MSKDAKCLIDSFSRVTELDEATVARFNESENSFSWRVQSDKIAK